MFVFSDVVIGYLQDKEKFLFGSGLCSFSKERWGRRAPWHIIHCPLMALFMFLSWAPPSLEPHFLAGWYFLVTFVCSWCWQQITIATQAGAVECYPFKVPASQLPAPPAASSACSSRCTTSPKDPYRG